MLTFEENGNMQIQDTDSMGRFHFPLEFYTDSIDVLLQSANKSGKNREYSIHLDRSPTPEITFDRRQSTGHADSITSYLLQKRKERAQAEQPYRKASEGIMLEEVVVEKKIRTMQEQKIFERYGEADATISGKAIQKKEKNWSYGLYSVLMSSFPDDIRINRVKEPDGHYYLRATVNGEMSTMPTLVVIDGVPVLDHSYDLIQYIPPSEVQSLEIIRFAKNFSELHREVYRFNSPMETPTNGSVIAIYTHAGKGLYGVRRPTGLLEVTVPVYSPIIEFYTPRYPTNIEKNAAQPDLRTLLHCVPQLYNADTTGEINIIIEAITPTGEIGY